MTLHWPPNLRPTPHRLALHRALSALPRGLSAKGLGVRLGRPPGAARAAAQRHGYEVRLAHRRPPAVSYAGVDWSRTDAAIARALGVTRQAVGLARRRHEREPSAGPRTGFMDHARAGKVDWRLPDRTIAAVYGMHAGAIHAVRRRLEAGPPRWTVRGRKDRADPLFVARRPGRSGGRHGGGWAVNGGGDQAAGNGA